MHTNRLRDLGIFAAGVVTGAAAVYLADVDRDGHRLRMAAQRVTRPGRELATTVRSRSHDLRNRARGALAGASARLRHDDVSDEQLAERVRAELGHRSERARLLEVHAHDGVVHLAGRLEREEVEQLGAAARQVRGVRDVTIHTRGGEAR